MTILDWPAGLPLFDAVELSLASSAGSPGTGLDGREQLVWRENRVWRGSLTLAALRGVEVLTLRGFADQLRGRFGAFRLPLCNRFTIKYGGDPTAFWQEIGYTAQEISDGYTKYSDATIFSDTTGFALADYSEPTVRVAAPAGATRLRLDGYIGRHLTVGAYLSIDGFLYRVASNADGDLRINPPLRVAAPVGTVADVSAPEIVVRLASSDGLRVIDNHNRIAPPISFDVVEAFDR